MSNPNKVQKQNPLKRKRLAKVGQPKAVSAPQSQFKSRRLNKEAPEFGPLEEKRFGGAIGVPGGRTLDVVKTFTALGFNNLKSGLTGILKMSKKIRKAKEADPKGYLDQARQQALATNRKVNFQAGDKTGVHSLHVGQDIYAYWNSEAKQKGRGYRYDELAPKLDLRLEQPTRTSAHGTVKKYWKKNKFNNTAEQRRQLVAQGMQGFIGGDMKTGNDRYTQAGLTDKGRKWANKMSNIMLAEKGREMHGALYSDAVHQALGNVGKNSFNDVFVNKHSTLAPFAGSGDASYFYTPKKK